MTPSPDLSKQRLNLQKEYDLLSTGKVERQLLRARGLNYESGEKAGRLLAHQLKVKANSQHIPQIKNILNQLTIIPSEINNVFKEFYSTLYQSESPPNDTDMEMFFEGIIFPKIGNDQAGYLEQSWNISEITKSIKAMQSGKTPGPDGFPIEFFKKFSDKLSPLLLNMFNESLAQGTLPQTLTMASVTLLLKPGKDADACGSYRPISLLNADYKILAKALAMRLETVIHQIISDDQTGFITNRHSFSNIRRLLNVIYSPASEEVPEMVISLDAENCIR